MNNNNFQNPTNPTNPQNQQNQRPQYIGASQQMPSSSNPMNLNQSRQRATTVGVGPGVTVGAQIGAQIRPTGPGASQQRPGIPNAMGNQNFGATIRPPTMNGFQTLSNTSSSGSFGQRQRIPGMPTSSQPNIGHINLQPPQGFQPPNTLNQQPNPLNKPPNPINQPPNPLNQPPNPINQPPNPINQPPAPINQQPNPINQPPTPINQQPTPINQPPTPINQQPTPINQQPNPINQQPTPIDQPPTPINQQPTPINQQPNPINQQPTPINQQPTPINQQPNPINQPSTPINQPSTPINQPSTPINKQPTPINQPPNPINQPPNPINQPQNPLSQPPNTLNKPTNPLIQPPNQLNQPQNPLSQPPNTLNKPTNPLIQLQNPLSQSQRMMPQNIPGFQQKRPTPANNPASQTQPQPLQLMGFNSALQQNSLRSSQDPPLLRSNSPSFPNANASNQQKQISQPQQANQSLQKVNIQPQQLNQQNQQPPQINQQPQQTQIFIRPNQKQPQQQTQQPQPQPQATSFQQMQLELKRKQQEEFLKRQQQIQQERLSQQQKRILLQQKQEEKERIENQQKIFEENQQIQQQQILNKIAQANGTLQFEQQRMQGQQPQKQENIPDASLPQVQPQLVSTPFAPQQQPLQVEPLVQPQQPPQIEPLSPQPLQVEPLVPLQQQPLNIEPLAPLQVEPLVPPQQQQQQPLQIEPLVPPQTQPLQVEPLVPPQQQPLNIEPLAPLQVEPLVPLQQQPLNIEPLAPLQVEPLVPPQQQPLNIEPLAPLQVEPLVPPQQQQPLQIEPLVPPQQQQQQQQPLQIQPLTPPVQQQPLQPDQTNSLQFTSFGNDPNTPPAPDNEASKPSFPSMPNTEANLSHSPTDPNHIANIAQEQSTVTLDFNEELSGDEDDNQSPSPSPQASSFKIRRSHTIGPNSSNSRPTFDTSKLPKFQGRRETLILQQGIRKRRNSSFQACLAPELNEEDMKSVNSQIQGILDDPNSGMNKFSWSAHYVVNCVQEENPYVDPKAISLSMQAAGSNNNVVKLFSEKVRPLHFQKVEENPPTEVTSLSTDSQNIPMLSDITDKTKLPSINKITDHEIPNAADYYFSKKPPPPLLFTIEDMPIAGLSKRKFASLRVRDVKTDFEVIEPLFFGAFIIQDGTIISEQWTFTNKGSSQFIQDIPNISKASFQLPSSLENAYFCVVVSRFLLPENGATVNKYYQKPNAKSLLAAKSQAINYDKFTGVYAPFALTFIDLKTVLENKYFDMPPPFSVSTPLKNIIKQIKPGAQKMGDCTYPIYLIFDANIIESSNIQDILVENTLFVRLAMPLPLTPCYSFRHRLLVKMNQANLHTQARNIYAELKVKSELGELPIFTTAYSNSKSRTVFTRCWYHDKKPFFDELFVIDLPLPLPKSLSLTVTFFNAVLKNVGQRGADPKELIGICTIPLLEGNNKFLSDGEHYYPVEYKGQPSISTPAFNISTLLDSSLISTDSNLNQFYENVDSKVLERCNDREVTINMFSIIDQIVNHFMNNGSECMKSFAILTKKKVSLDWNIIENCLNDYAIYFAFRNESACTPQFHRSLLSSWAEFMKTNPDSNRTDSRLIPFFFNMIIKSLYLTKDQNFSKEFSAFIVQWSKLLDSQQIGEYARFLNLLFDIGCYYYSVIAIECQMANLLNITSKHQILIEFLSQVLRPKLFYSALVYVDRLKLNIIDMIKYSKRPDCTALQFIYRTFLRLFAQYSGEMKQKIAERLINSLEILSPFESIHFIGDDGNHPVIYYYCFILSCVSYEAFSNWLSHQVDHFSDFFKTLHFMIANIKDKELRRVSYFAILHIISFIEQMKDLEGVIEATNIIYHFLCVDLPLDFISPLINTFCSLIEENYEILLVYSNPALPRHLVKLLNLSYLVPNEVVNLIKILYETDKRIYGSILRSHSVCCRAVYSIKSLETIKLPQNTQLPIMPVIYNLMRINHLIKSQLSEEKLTEMIYEKARMMFPSPDSTIECLNELIEYHRKHEYSAEEIQVLILQASIILEFLVHQGKMDISYLHIDTPSKLFSELCPICERFRCPEGGDFIVKSYCDSPMFSERSLINHLIFIIERSMETKYHEVGYLLIDRIWPILEHRRIYTLLTNTFTRFGDCYKALAEIPPDEDRLFGHYFRICFYGNVFREENGKIYIYREKKLTHLFELTNRLVDYYTEICKPTKIELIKESGAVDVTKLEQNKGYIQITFVEPYFPKSQNYTRVTSFERSHVLDSFFFDTPFTKGGNKAQASIDQQWVRRTVLHVETPMPSIVKRINVTLSEEIEFAPIRVAYRQIRDRISLLKNAIERSDYRAIQQLLHGSLLVQVNEGPSKMAEVFLGEDGPSSENAIDNYIKYKDKMKAAFKEFLIANQKGIDMHGKYVEDHSVFIPLQHELESGFTALQETISKYV